MLVFGTQIHIVTFIFILLETGMFIFQFFYYLFRPQDKNRLWYFILLCLLLFYNITGGLFPDSKINIAMTTQYMIAYGSGFLMASYFPFYFYKAFALRTLRWHALFGVLLFLMLPYLLFFVIIYAINENLDVDIKFGVVIPFLYSLVLLWLILRAIHEHYQASNNQASFIEEIAVYGAVSPWAAMTVFSWFQVSQLTEVLCTNLGFIVITIIYILKAIRGTRKEYADLVALRAYGQERSPFFETNCVTYGLTRREIEIVQFIHKGLKNKAIADNLHISAGTVKKHIENLFHKTHATSRVELIHKLIFAPGPWI
ncbi:MAG: Regulatory protein luxR family [Mucilaginibacter sp.]|nr:Regulatory protein luxR family [Mucilaginibacter sp.]